MNYELIYYELVISRQYREMVNGTYYERHHILPKSMGGTEDKENLVYLTGREHFIAHALLAKFVTNSKHKAKMYYAFFAMCNQKRAYQNRYTPKSKIYDTAKRLQSIAMSDKHTGKKLSAAHIEALRLGHTQYHKHNSEEFSELMRSIWTNEKRESHSVIMSTLGKCEIHRSKVSEGLRDYWKSEARYAHIQSIRESTILRLSDPKEREKISNGIKRHYINLTPEEYEIMCQKKRDAVTDEFRSTMSNISKINADKIHSKVECEYCIKMISRQNYAKYHGEKCSTLSGIKHSHPRIDCTYCGKSCSPSTLSRWHNENCKFK